VLTVSPTWSSSRGPRPPGGSAGCALVNEHHAATQSPLAERSLRDFDRELAHFRQIVPKEMLDKLEVPVRAEAEALRASAASWLRPTVMGSGLTQSTLVHDDGERLLS
jgi:hypothetical protein